jgi:hypothetical protein
MIKGNKKYALKRMLCGSDKLAPALFRAILDVFPVLGPLLSPLKSPTAANADLWLEAVLGLWGGAHYSSLIRPQRQVLDNASQVHCEEQHYDSTNTVDPLELWPLDKADFALITLATKHGKNSKEQHRDR